MLTYRNEVFIAVLVFYSCTLILSTVRLIQHGLKKAVCERLLLTFSLGRVLCAAFQLATINDPTNTSIWAGYVTTFSICVSLLLSAALVLLRRLAQRAGTDFPVIGKRDSMKFLQLLVSVGLILGVVGGILTNEDWGKSGHYSPSSLSKVSIAIFLVSWVIIVLLTFFTLGRASGAMVKKEQMAVAAFAISLPLLLVRIIYSAISTFANPSSFSTITGNVTIMLCMALIEEMIIVIIFEGLGINTLRREEKIDAVGTDYDQLSAMEVGKHVSR